MLTVLVCSSKGGCGKSTLATNLAAHFAHQGKPTAIIDKDRQGSSLSWCGKRASLDVPQVAGFADSAKAGRAPEPFKRIVIDVPAGIRMDDLESEWEGIDAVVVPIMPSIFDLEATRHFLSELAQIKKIKRGKVPVALVANRMKPWTHASQKSLEAIEGLPFPLAAQLRDSSGYSLLGGLGKSIFDYQSENVLGHQQDWQPLLKWLKKNV